MAVVLQPKLGLRCQAILCRRRAKRARYGQKGLTSGLDVQQKGLCRQPSARGYRVVARLYEMAVRERSQIMKLGVPAQCFKRRKQIFRRHGPACTASSAGPGMPRRCNRHPVVLIVLFMLPLLTQCVN